MTKQNWRKKWNYVKLWSLRLKHSRHYINFVQTMALYHQDSLSAGRTDVSWIGGLMFTLFLSHSLFSFFLSLFHSAEASELRLVVSDAVFTLLLLLSLQWSWLSFFFLCLLTNDFSLSFSTLQELFCINPVREREREQFLFRHLTNLKTSGLYVYIYFKESL